MVGIVNTAGLFMSWVLSLGATHPGATIVCGDSHTSTHGAFGAIAFGIGTTQVGHVLANQCILMRKPKTMAINVNGKLNQGVTPKDVILHIISLIGIGGGTGYAIEYRGNVFEDMSMDGRMTVCNMSIEAGARCGMIAPDEVTFEFLKGRKYTPKNYEDSCAEWLSLSTDEGAVFDKEINIKAASIKPMVTYGTHPGMGIPIDSTVPQSSNPAEQASLNYMQIKEGDKMLGMKG